MIYKLQKNIELSPLGRRKNPFIAFPNRSSSLFPIGRMKIGDSFEALPFYDYGKAMSIKNIVRRRADALGKNSYQFSVREHNGGIRVWRTR
jgi:hypothetical protein